MNGAFQNDGHALDRHEESFQGLLLRLRGRTGLSQRDVASRLGMHPRSIQGWESGTNYPVNESLQALIALYLEANGFSDGRETAEAEALWAAALRQAPRLRTPLDANWLADAVAKIPASSVRRSAASSGESGSARRQDWGEAPGIGQFQGRSMDLGVLRRWISAERCRIVALVGMGGIGKTMLAARLADDLVPDFERVYWRNLRDALPLDEWLAGAIVFVSDGHMVLPKGQAARLNMLLDLLRSKRCLLVLDNVETVLEPGQRMGRYREGYGGYGTLIRRLGESDHQSSLVLTSREAPPELGPLQGQHAAVRSFDLEGLGVEDGRAMLQDKALDGDDGAWAGLINRYGGNGLALKMAGETIARVFGGDIAGFLSTADAVFGGFRELLDEQLERLSDLELSALRWFAVDREPVDYAAMSANLGVAAGATAVLEAVEALRRRSLLVERRDQNSAFTLQSAVLEHVTDQMVEDITREIATDEPVLLLSHALVKATAWEYVRRSQERQFAIRIVERLTARYGTEGETERHLVDCLSRLRMRPRAEQGYGPGNLVNLLRSLRGDLDGVDMSGLELRQVFLRDVEARDANLSGSHLSQSTLAESFDYPLPVALSADGTYVAAGTAGGEVRLWRVPDGTPIMSKPGHTGVVMSVALSGDRQLLASGGMDGMVKVWECATGRLVATLPGHAGGVWGLALSRDNRLLASCGQDGTVKLWEPASGQLLATLAVATEGLMAVALSGDGRLVVSGGQNGKVSLWDTTARHPLGTLSGHAGGVWAVALSCDGRLVASGGADGTAKLWAVASSECLATLADHTDQVWGVALNADGRLLASGSLDGSVKLWETGGGTLMTTLPGHTGAVVGIALSPDGRLAASAGQDGTIRLWEVRHGRLLTTLQGRADQVYGAAVGAEGRLVASGGQDGAIRLWEPFTGELLATSQGHTGAILGVALSEDGNLVASGGNDGLVNLWDSASGRLRGSLVGHTGAVWCVALSDGQQLLASGGGDESIKLWDPASGRLVGTLPGHSGGVTGVAFSVDGRLLASCGQDGAIKLWKPTTGELMTTLASHTGAAWCVAVSADGRLVSSGGADRTARVWEVITGRLIATLAGHTGLVRAVAVSADGRVVATGSIDGPVRLWEVTTGRQVATLEGHRGLVTSLSLSSNGRLLASSSTDGTLKTWDVNSGTVLRTLRADRRYERMDISGLSGVTQAQRQALLALGALDRH